MTVELTSKEGVIIRKLIPIGAFPRATLVSLCANMAIEELKDNYLFKKGDTDPKLVYLISGTVSLEAQGLQVDTISAGSESGRFALAHQLPRKIDALAKGTVRFIRLDAELVNNPQREIQRDEDSYVVIEEAEQDEDWAGSLLKLPIFQNLHPTDLQKFLLSMETVLFKQGDIILEQGSIEQYFYLIKSGFCLVSYQFAEDEKPIKLAHIGRGYSLGEDALIFGAPRNDTVTALTNCELLRWDKRHFLECVKEPSLEFVILPQMLQLLISGALLLDIRSQFEFKQRHFNGSLNIPAQLLRNSLHMVARDRVIIIVANNHKTGAAAAFYLLKHGFKVLVLQENFDNIVVSPENEAFFFASPTTNSGLQGSSPGWKNPEGGQQLGNETSHVSDMHEYVAALESENERLKKKNSVLKQRYQETKKDKEAAEKECRILLKQIDKLTQVLNRFKLAREKIRENEDGEDAHGA